MNQMNKFILGSLIVTSSLMTVNFAYAAEKTTTEKQQQAAKAVDAAIESAKLEAIAEAEKAEKAALAAKKQAEALKLVNAAIESAKAEAKQSAAKIEKLTKALEAKKATEQLAKAKKSEADKQAIAEAKTKKIAADKQAAALKTVMAAVELAKIEAAKAAAQREAIINPLGVANFQQATFTAYSEFPEILFNPTKPVKNPLTVYKLRNIVHNLPALDGLTRLNIQKLAKTNSVIKGVKIWKAERKTLRRELILNNYKSYWFTDNLLNIDKANQVIATAENAENFALRPASYNLDALKQLIAQSSNKIDAAWLKVPGSTEKLEEIAQEDEALSQLALNNAKLELALTHIAFAYSRDASAGQLIPSAVDRNNDVHPVATSAVNILEKITAPSKTGELQKWLEAQNPQSPQFKALLAEFKKQSGITSEQREQPIIVPTGKSLRKGMRSKRVIKLAMRLEQLGFYKKAANAEYPQAVTQDIIDAVKAFQQDRGLWVDGVAGINTIGTMNYKRPDYLKTLLVNLERQRWMPHDRGNKHVLVNQAEFRVRVYEDNKVTHSARVVIGKNKHQTPIFYNKIRTVVVNPYWNIPASIIYNEMRNKINNDPTYLARNNYQLSGTLNWEKATKRYVPFSIRQKPGARNALGRVKFLFPNRHSIYMHDTPSKSLFSRTSRAFSHGCVRVQNPELLALNLMGWSQKKYDSLIRSGRNQHFAMKTKIPVYMTYMTANVGENGKMHYFRDVYRRDAAVAKALGVKQILQQIADKQQTSSTQKTVMSSN